MESLSKQVGGTHYKGLKYQPVQLAANIDLNFFQTNIIKYVSRFKEKDGLRDLHKVIHYAQLGCDLNPRNHYSPTDSKELVLYVKENELTPEIGEICYQAAHQNWLRVASLTKLLIEQEYGTDVPQE